MMNKAKKYSLTKRVNFYIVEFNWVYSNMFKSNFFREPHCVHSLNKVIYQPELRKRFNRDKNGKLHLPDRFIWGRIISRELYKKSVESFGEDLELKMTGHEDTIIQFMLFKYGKSFKKIRKIGICHFLYPTSTSKSYYSNNNAEATCLSFINLIDILCKHIENTTMAKEDCFS